MFDNMRRLHPRGPTNRGIAVDDGGAVLGPDCVLVRRTAAGHRPIGREEAGAVQALLLRDHQDPDWLFQQCGRIARALNEGQLPLAQIYGLHIPIGELDDRRLSQLSRLTALTRAGFNPDEPRVPKGDPRGGEWTTGGDVEGSGSASDSTSPAPGTDDAEGDGDAAGGSGSSASPMPSDLGAGDPGGGRNGSGDGGTVAGDNGISAPKPSAGASDAPPQNPPLPPANPASLGEPAISFTIVEPQDGAPAGGPPSATDSIVPPIGVLPSLDSPDLGDQVAQPSAIPATTSEPTEPNSGSAPGEGGLVPDPEASASGQQPLGLPPEFPAEEPLKEGDINPVLRRTAVWLARAARILGPLFSSDPRVRLIYLTLDAVVWLAKWAPRVTSYLDPPKSLQELQDAVDHPRPGYQRHHIVEVHRQNPQGNSKRFPDRIESRDNLVLIPYWKHVEISTLYSMPDKQLGWISPREYLRDKSWEEQYRFGIKILRDFGVLE